MNSIMQAVMGLVLAIIGLAPCTTAVAQVAPLQDLANAADAAGPPAPDS